MIRKFQSFSQLVGEAKAGLTEVCIVEYRGRDVKCLWGPRIEGFAPKEDGFICLYNDSEFKVFACFAGTKTEVKDIDKLQIINCVGHDIHILNEIGDCVRTIFAQTGEASTLIRMQEKDLKCPDLDGIKTFKKEYTKQDKIPQKQEGIYYVVSWIVKVHFPDRTDFLCPDEQVYVDGKPIGCRALRR